MGIPHGTFYFLTGWWSALKYQQNDRLEAPSHFTTLTAELTLRTLTTLFKAKIYKSRHCVHACRKTTTHPHSYWALQRKYFNKKQVDKRTNSVKFSHLVILDPFCWDLSWRNKLVPPRTTAPLIPPREPGAHLACSYAYWQQQDDLSQIEPLLHLRLHFTLWQTEEVFALGSRNVLVSRGETVFGEKLRRHKDKYLLLISTCTTNPVVHLLKFLQPNRASSQINYRKFSDSTRHVHDAFNPGAARQRLLIFHSRSRWILGPQQKPVWRTDFPSAHGIVGFTSNPIIIYTWDGISQRELITRSILVMSVASTGQLCWPGKNRCAPSTSNWCPSSLKEGRSAVHSSKGLTITADSDLQSGLKGGSLFYFILFVLSFFWEGQWTHLC